MTRLGDRRSVSRLARRSRIAGVLAAALGLGSAEARAQEPPRAEGYVTDRAGLLGAEERQRLEEELRAYARGSGNEIAVLTVTSLERRPIEVLGLEFGRRSGVGSKDKNTGAVLVVAQAERQVRIEVGRGLEGNLTDLVCGRIIRDVIVPRFKAGAFAEGIRKGAEAMRAAAGGDLSSLPPDPPESARSRIVALIFRVMGLAFFAFMAWRSARRDRGGSRSLRRTTSWGPPFFGGFGGGLGGGGRSGGGGGFGGFGGGGGFSGGGATGRW